MSTHDDFNDLEQMLGDLPTRQPSQMLDERVASTLASPTRSRLGQLAAAAAVFIVGAVLLTILFTASSPDPDTRPVATHPDPSFDPAKELAAITPSTNGSATTMDAVWTRDLQEQTRYTPLGRPYKAVLRESLYQRAWVNQESGSSYEIQVPWHELIVVSQPTF